MDCALASKHTHSRAQRRTCMKPSSRDEDHLCPVAGAPQPTRGARNSTTPLTIHTNRPPSGSHFHVPPTPCTGRMQIMCARGKTENRRLTTTTTTTTTTAKTTTTTIERPMQIRIKHQVSGERTRASVRTVISSGRVAGARTFDYLSICASAPAH